MLHAVGRALLCPEPFLYGAGMLGICAWGGEARLIPDRIVSGVRIHAHDGDDASLMASLFADLRLSGPLIILFL